MVIKKNTAYYRDLGYELFYQHKYKEAAKAYDLAIKKYPKELLAQGGEATMADIAGLRHRRDMAKEAARDKREGQ